MGAARISPQLEGQETNLPDVCHVSGLEVSAFRSWLLQVPAQRKMNREAARHNPLARKRSVGPPPVGQTLAALAYGIRYSR